MKRSTNVTAPLLASAALSLLAGCRQHEMKRCVDDHNVVVDNSLCDAQQNQQQQRPGGGYPGYFPYHYYYGGYGGFGRGSVVSGGSTTPRAGASYSTSRGGFGSTHASGGE
ncbi:MAG TPA: hypothetical protein VJU82_08225 [Acidobacteriaceae bacterium]|nr:hypothetical protein [Acidobacteriaceae bacterium]